MSPRPSSALLRPVQEVRDFFRASLVQPLEHDHVDPAGAVVRRRVVAGVTLAVGAVALGLAISVRPGDPMFYPWALGVAAIWAVGAFGSGRLYLGRGRTRSGGTSWSIVQSLILGGLLLAVFLAGGLVVARIPALSGPVDGLLDHARYGSLALVTITTIISGFAEELFFRGALFAALPDRWRVAGSSLLYAVATVFTGVPLLVFAALALGLLVSAQRRVTGGFLGPVITHLTWSVGMLYLLPITLDLGRTS